mmetsp:Transcript_9204/g.27644  ORF Transcript_9204/g.27644 Transcript_9204/m.27644 type:complete len:228 (-) Transcript_9204:310-993(-)
MRNLAASSLATQEGSWSPLLRRATLATTAAITAVRDFSTDSGELSNESSGGGGGWGGFVPRRQLQQNGPVSGVQRGSSSASHKQFMIATYLLIAVVAFGALVVLGFWLRRFVPVVVPAGQPIAGTCPVERSLHKDVHSFAVLVMQPDEAITLAIKLAAVKAEEASWDAEVAGPTPAHVGSGAAPSHQPIQLVRSLLPRQLQHPARLQQAARDYQAPVLNQWTRNFIR